MDVSTKAIFLRKLEFDQKNKQNSNEERLNGEKSEEPTKVAPERKPITASVEDALAAYNQGGITFVSTTDDSTHVPSGTYILSDGRLVIHEYDNGNIGFQYHGKGDYSLIEIRKLISKGMTPLVNEPYSNGVNGEIDEPVSQGGTGDCWILTGILSLTATAEGRALIKSSMEIQQNGDVIVHFKGLGYSVRVTAAEIKKHDTDNIKNDPFSNGDNDMLVFELAIEKLFEEHPELRVKYDYDENTQGDDKYVTQGGFGNDVVEWLSGNASRDVCAVDKLEDPYEKADIVEWVTVPNSVSKYAGREFPRPSSISYDAMFNADKTNFSREYISWYNKTYSSIIDEYNNDFKESLVEGLSQEEIFAILKEAYQKQPCAVSFGLYVFANDTEKTVTDINGNSFVWRIYSNNVQKGEICGHAFAVVDMTQDTITFVNPWDSTDKITMTWEEFAKLGIGRISYNELDKVEDTTEPDIPDEPVNPDTPYDAGLAELKAKGFTQEDIDEYFDKTEDGKYELKSGIKYSNYDIVTKKKTIVEITSIEQLQEYCGAKKRLELLNDGWPEELIDKYFVKKRNPITHKYTLELKNLKDSEQEYRVTKKDDGTIIIGLNNSAKIKIVIKPDGTYEEIITNNEECATLDDLKSMGFTSEQIETWFTDNLDGTYGFKDGIRREIQISGGLVREFTTIKDLARYCGAAHRAELREEGIPDEIINQYFELKPTGTNGRYTYELKFEGDYTVTEQGENKLIRIVNKENDTVMEILVKKDGTYTIETNEIIAIEESDAKPVAGSANELLAQGFTQSDLDKYFYKKNNQYFLKSGITFFRDGRKGVEKVVIHTLDELKEYSGANSRNELKKQGLPDELIDKYYKKEQDANGKIVYELRKQAVVSIYKDGDNTIFVYSETDSRFEDAKNGTKSASAVGYEYTIKPDGSYTVFEYNSNQINDTTRTRLMLIRLGLSEQDINKFFTEKDGLYTLKKGIMYKDQTITTVEELVKALENNKNNNKK